MKLFNAFILLLVFAATPVIADTSPAEQFAKARGHLQSGEHHEALKLLDTLREQHPNDVDYAFARAIVLERLDRSDEALAELETAATLAPDYEDIWRMHYRLLQSQRDPDARQRRENLRATAKEQFPTATWWQTSVDDPFWNVTLGSGYDDLSRNLPGWNDQFLEVTRRVPSSGNIGLRLARYARYDNEDYVLALSAERTLSNDWFVGGSVALTSDAAFQANSTTSMHAGKPFAEGWVGTFRYQHKAFDDTSVGSLSGTLEKYLGDFRLAYSITASRLDNAGTFFGHSATANWYLSEDASLGVTVSAGAEAELLGNGRVLESDVQGIALTGRFRVSNRATLSAWLGTHEQGDFYRRNFLGLAVSIEL